MKKRKNEKPKPRNMWGMSFDGTAEISLQQSVKSKLNDISASQTFPANAVNPTGL